MGQSFSYLMKFYAPFPGRINSQKEYSALFQGFGVFLAIILLFLVSSGATQHIYFEHDDWDFMTKLAPGMVPYASPWQKTLSEGRWVNWVWSLQANNLPARFIYCLYILGYCLLCWLSSCLISSKFFYRMLIAFLLFFSVPFSSLSLWSATLTPMVWLSALFVFSILIVGFNLFLFAFYNIVIFLSYSAMISSITLIVLSIFPYFCVEIVLFYGVSYLLGVLTSFFLNKVFHGKFGIIFEGWRKAHPLHGLEDLKINILKVSHFWIDCFSIYKIEFIISFFILLSAFYFNRRQTIQFVFGSFIVFLFETLIQVASGLDVPVRSTYWIWCFFIGAFSVFIRAEGSDTRIKRSVAFLGAVPIIGSGVLIWSETIQHSTKVSEYEYYLKNRIEATGAATVYACGDNQTVPALKDRSYRALRLAMWKQYEINLQPGPDAVCEAVASLPWTDMQLMPDHTAIVRFPAGKLDTTSP
ncbi:hypothetical protein [Acetobacter malorum]|uniref:hypothetical protein n=1 Tax=Acetobacter malorum TaxID=178901 RepID=UPI00248E622B|nr:hypothetical protein [Acetobacter malorum]